MTKIYQIRKQLPGKESNPIEVVKESLSKKEIYDETREKRKLNDGYVYWMYGKPLTSNKENVQRI